MFGGKGGSKPHNNIECLIGAGTTIEGSIIFSGGLRVDGSVIGPVHAAEYVELQPKASVTGDVHYKTLEIQLGAVVQGRLVYESGGKSETVVKLKPAAAE